MASIIIAEELASLVAAAGASTEAVLAESAIEMTTIGAAAAETSVIPTVIGTEVLGTEMALAAEVEMLSAGGPTPLELGLNRVGWDMAGRAALVASGVAGAHLTSGTYHSANITPGQTPPSKASRVSTPDGMNSGDRRGSVPPIGSIPIDPHNLPRIPFPNMNIDATPTASNHDRDFAIQTTNRPHAAAKIRKISYRGGKNSGLANDLYRDRKVFGDHLIQQQQNRCTALTMKIGKHEKGKKGDSIEKMLSNLSGSGSVTSQWGGIIQSEIGQRSAFMTLLRHNLSYDQNNAISYNTTATDGFPCDNILMPNAIDIDVGGGTTVSSAFHQHDNESVWWTPITRPDLEDMAWNLNKFKLISTIKNTTFTDPVDTPVVGGLDGLATQDREVNMADATGLYGPGGTFSELASYLNNIPPSLGTNVAPTRIAYHRRQSELRLNNQRAPTKWSWTSPFVNSSTSALQRFTYVRGDTYKYNMVMKSGSLLYNFMNKDPNAAEVTAVVYKVKKTALIGGLSASINTNQLWNRLTKPIGLGYVSSVQDKFGTEDLEGRVPDEDDIHNLPNFPFLPKLSKTKQQTLPFTEVMRNTFVMPSGSRRKLKIDLPGEVYDPANIPLANSAGDGYALIYPEYLMTGSQQANGTENVGPYYSVAGEFTPKSKYVSIVDEYTYAVVLAVNGVQSSRLFYDPITEANQGTTDEFLLGDTYSSANIQYNCDYTENIQAVEYKSSGKARLYNNALAPLVSAAGGTMEETTTCILPVGQAVRQATSTVHVVNEDGTTSAYRQNTGNGVSTD